ncbi:MAG: thioredoxin family protein [Gammaproteobacteria bacterium]|nr:thioredoxin family protein [Gammaproteobacteria bacterium]
MALTETPVCNFGESAHDFYLEDTEGNMLGLADCRGEKGTLVMFICNHCPYVKAIQESLVAETRALLDLGVKSVAIMPNDTTAYPEDSLDNMRRIARQFDYPFPYLIDETQEVARTYGAVCTPDFYGYNNRLELQYRGRLNAITPAHPATPDMRRDLYEAMREIANTGQGPNEQIPSMGCSIKWKS